MTKVFEYESDALNKDGYCLKLKVMVDVTISRGPVYDSPKGPLGDSKYIDDWNVVAVFSETGHKLKRIPTEVRAEIEKEFHRIERRILDEANI